MDMGRRSTRSCIRCGEYISGGGVELCDACIREIESQGKVRRFYKTVILTLLLALGYYYVFIRGL